MLHVKLAMTEANAPERFASSFCIRLTMALLILIITLITLMVFSGTIGGMTFASGINYLLSGKQLQFDMWEDFVIEFAYYWYWLNIVSGSLLMGSVLPSWNRIRLPGVAWLVSVDLLNVSCVILLGAAYPYRIVLIGGTLILAAIALFVWISRLTHSDS